MPDIKIKDADGVYRTYEGVSEIELDTTTPGETAVFGYGAVKLASIAITTPPTKTEYAPGDTFDPDGMVVIATYDNGATRNVTALCTFSPATLALGDTSVTVSFSEGGVTATATQAVTVADPVHIYGVEWDGTSTTKWSRTDDSASFTDPVPYVAGATEYGSPFDNLMPWSGMVKSEDAAAGTLVAIPKFWYKLEKIGAGLKIQIADAPVDGFYTSPAHMNRGDGHGERDMVYIGRYHCASDYKSKTGVTSGVNIRRSAARSGIHALGSDVWQWDFATRFSLQLLFLVEFADWNSQAVIGYGRGNGSSTQSMGYTDSMPYHTGTTQASRTTYGLGTQYRNIEGLWDNVYDWCDGCYYNISGLNVIANPASFSDSSGGKVIGVPSNGYPSAFSVSSAAGYPTFYPTEAGGSETTYSCDYLYFSASYPCLYVGGHYERNGKCGLFYASYSGTSHSSDNVGSRLMKLPNA